jgi:hypothetical protein
VSGTVDPNVLATVFEIGMLFCFGISWPFAMMKTYRSKNIGGKSPVFLWFVCVGYVCGILFKVFDNLDWVIALYALNGVMVAADMALYYHYRRLGAKSA